MPLLRNVKRNPFARLLLYYAAGILVFPVLPRVVPLGIIIFLLILCSLVLYFLAFYGSSFRSGLYSGMAAGGMLFAAGLLSCSLDARRTASGRTLPGEEGVYRMIVLDVPYHPSGTSRVTVRLACDSGASGPFSPGRILLYFKEGSGPLPDAGDIITVHTRLLPLPAPKNPGAFNYGAYLERHHVVRIAYPEKGDWRSTGIRKLVMPALACRLRNELLARYGRAGLTQEQQALLAALTLGYREDVDASTEKAFSRAGVMHIMALSGFNVGILATVLLFLLGGFRSRNNHRLPSIGITLALIWGFAFVTGMSPSVTRAAVMISLTLSGSPVRYRVHTPNILLASGFIMLSVSPQMLFDAGFQLSFAAVGGIILFEPTLTGLLKSPHKIITRLWQLFSLSCSAQLATLPLTLLYFHQFPLYFWLTNLYVVPLVSVIIVMGMVLLLCSGWYSLAMGVGKLLGMLLNHLLFSVTLTEHLPGALISGLHISLLQAVLLAGAIFCLALYLKNRSHLLLKLMLTGGILFQVQGIWLQLVWREQQIFLIPSVKKMPAAVFVTGRNAVLLADSLSPDSQAALSRALDGFYLSRGIRPLPAEGSACFPMHTSGSYPQPVCRGDWQGRNCLLAFHRMKVVWLFDNRIAGNRTGPIVFPDILVVSKGCRLEAGLVLKLLPARQVVLDGSATRWQCDQWVKVCKESGIPCHAVPRQGAYVCDRSGFRNQSSTGPFP